MRVVYRIEDLVTMNGMWYNHKGEFSPTIHTLCPESIAKDFPMGYCEDHRRFGKIWYSAGKSKEGMKFWFSRQDAIKLIQNGFKLYEYTVNEFFEKENEILFTREGVVNSRVIDYTEIWSDE